jgi:RES domain
VPYSAPPLRYNGIPNRMTVPVGTELWRVHSRARHPGAFNPVPADRHFGGGRFDGTYDDPYGYLYAGFDESTAIAESFLRSLPFDQRGFRTLPRRVLAERRVSSVCTTSRLTLLALTKTADLAAVCQDEWLVQAEAQDYAFTRRWAHWLRAQAPWAQGLVWSSKRELGEPSVVLFADRCPDDVLAVCGAPGFDLDDAAGAKWLKEVLAPYRVTVRPPRGA